ncbi:MAG: aminomethyl-transferring glycine dehydrogenase subunit GcvPA [Fervidicoccaceae archaeon]
MNRSHPWIPNDDEKIIEKMLAKIGINNVMEMFSDIPKELIIRRKLKVGKGRPLSVMEIERELGSLLEESLELPLNRIFAGGPIAPHYTHPVVDAIISRGELLSAYTPYQPEISQGLLQMLYEYQSAMALLYGVEIVNAGMYDGATALAEASLMAVRIKKLKKIMVPRTLFKEYKQVLKTYFFGHQISLVEYDFDEETGETTAETISQIKAEKPAAVIIDFPANNGAIRLTAPEVIHEAHAAGSLAITFTDPSSLGILKSPGELGADIVVGEGQSLGLPMYGGGMLLGILGIRDDRELIRNLPGRLIGETVDSQGRRGYVMILQTREQHIRRERATSNITTGSSLNSIAALVSLAIKGESGLREDGKKILDNTEKLKSVLKKIDAEITHSKAKHFKNVEFSLQKEIDPRKIQEKTLKEKGLLPFTLYESKLMSCSTEVHTDDDLRVLEISLEEALE